MNIKEDYVSFEVAKLLKEKGFDEKTLSYYEDNVLCRGDWFEWNRSPLGHIAAPTHQMAMKWLREKGVYMSIDTVISSSGNIYFNIDTYSEESGWNHPVDFYESYEEAVEAALKYSLENLI